MQRPALARRLHLSPNMACKLITCPEAGHLEMIVYEDSPFGMLIDACTRFPPGCPMDCPRTCASRMDLKARCGIDLDVGDTTTFELRLPQR